jgi:hypothetical protein
MKAPKRIDIVSNDTGCYDCTNRESEVNSTSGVYFFRV